MYIHACTCTWQLRCTSLMCSHDAQYSLKMTIQESKRACAMLYMVLALSLPLSLSLSLSLSLCSRERDRSASVIVRKRSASFRKISRQKRKEDAKDESKLAVSITCTMYNVHVHVHVHAPPIAQSDRSNLRSIYLCQWFITCTCTLSTYNVHATCTVYMYIVYTLFPYRNGYSLLQRIRPLIFVSLPLFALMTSYKCYSLNSRLV